MISYLCFSLLVQLRVGVRDSTWPVLGNVDEKDKYSHFNPFYSQERIAFRFSAPKLELKPFSDSLPTPSQTLNASTPTNPSAPSQPSLNSPTTAVAGQHPNIRPPLLPNTQRSISVVEFAPPSPAMIAATAASLGKSDLASGQANNHKEVGHSLFFSKDDDTSSTSSGRKDSSTDSTIDDPIQLVESSDWEGVSVQIFLTTFYR